MVKVKRNKLLKDYIDDKEEMVEQVFKSIPEGQIKSMIPNSLKDMTMHELKADCLVQLLTMSDKNIIDTLEGRKSLSPTRNEDAVIISDDEEKRFIKQEKNHMSSDDVLEINIEEDEIKEIELGGGTCARDMNRTAKRPRLETNKKTEKRKDKVKTKKEKEVEEKNLLELLELEMRARAIRALLKKEEENEMKGMPTPPETTGSDDDVVPIEVPLPQIELSSDSDDLPEVPSTSTKSDAAASNWTQRWLNSKDVKKVVATSKMLTTVRKKIKTKLKRKETDPKTETITVVGSVQEYDKLNRRKT